MQQTHTIELTSNKVKVNPRSLKFHMDTNTSTSYFPLKSASCLKFKKQEPIVTNETLRSNLTQFYV